MSKKQLYIAYGSNINLEQMAYRCPHSKVLGTAESRIMSWSSGALQQSFRVKGQAFLF